MGFLAFAFGVLLGSIGCASLVFLVLVGPMKASQESCKRQHNVYECRVMAVPVTPDGQPLDMSDPFHGEDE